MPQTPEAGQLEVLLARLRKLLGEDRVGAPELLDSHRPDAFRMVPFVPKSRLRHTHAASGIHTSALRCCGRLARCEWKWKIRAWSALLSGWQESARSKSFRPVEN